MFIYIAMEIILRWNKSNYMPEIDILRNCKNLGVLNADFWGYGCPNDNQTVPDTLLAKTMLYKVEITIDVNWTMKHKDSLFLIHQWPSCVYDIYWLFKNNFSLSRVEKYLIFKSFRTISQHFMTKGVKG